MQSEEISESNKTKAWASFAEGMYAIPGEGNALFVWQALDMVISGQTINEGKTFAEDFVIPGWIAQYLRDVAFDLNEIYHEYLWGPNGSRPARDAEDLLTPGFGPLERTPEAISAAEALERVPSAMGFASQGWNAFEKALSVDRDRKLHWHYWLRRRRGMSSEDTLQELSAIFGIKSIRTLQRRIARGKTFEDPASMLPTGVNITPTE